MTTTDTPAPLAEPFNHLFRDEAEATWAFDWLRETATRLGIGGAADQRFALTLTRRGGKPGLHLSFGPWLVLGFQGRDRVELPLLTDRVEWDERLADLPSEPKESQPNIRSYHLPRSLVTPLTSDLEAAYDDTLALIAEKFRHWQRATPWKQHRTELIESLFDPDKRAELFAGGLTEPDMLYERQLTAFYDVQEEGIGYQEVEGTKEQDIILTDEEISTLEETSPTESEILMKPEQLQEQLKNLFYQFRQNTYDSFVVKLRQKRAEELRNLLSNPENVDSDIFNREVWVLQDSMYLKGEKDSQKIDLYGDKQAFGPYELAKLEQALEADEIEFHGNSIWGSGSRVYATRLKDKDQKTKYIHEALSVLNRTDISPLEKVEKITGIYGFGNNIATGLVMVFHPDEFNIYNREGIRIVQNLGYEFDNSIQSYQTILKNIKEELQAKDFIELDWFLYRVYFGHYNLEKIPIVEQEMDSQADGETNSTQIKPSINPPYPLPALAEKTGFDEADLSRWVRAIERKGQAILYGPPGTGKTYLAEQLARHLIGGGDGFDELVQFHPAYAYEDFMQGIRPESEGTQLSYPMKPGRFLEFCRQAEGRETCVLIIDEINRANLTRVFGELMYLLEYRERKIPLAGDGTPFTIPANVRLIGTMNTADRSIALVDHALRRRFAFIRLWPNYDLLRRFHQQHPTGFPVEGLIGLLQKLNNRIEENYQVGITFFLHEELDTEIEDIWRMEIEPYLEEYFFGQPEAVAEFRWARVRGEIEQKG